MSHPVGTSSAHALRFVNVAEPNVFLGATSAASPRGDVHAATEGDGEMREVTADTRPVAKNFQRRPCHARIRIRT